MVDVVEAHEAACRASLQACSDRWTKEERGELEAKVERTRAAREAAGMWRHDDQGRLRGPAKPAVVLEFRRERAR